MELAGYEDWTDSLQLTQLLNHSKNIKYNRKKHLFPLKIKGQVV